MIPFCISVTYCLIQVKLYAEYAPTRLLDFLRASNHYSLEEVRWSSLLCATD